MAYAPEGIKRGKKNPSLFGIRERIKVSSPSLLPLSLMANALP
jgi:hypothetical protein